MATARVLVTKQFTSGLLNGLTVEQDLPAGIFAVGDVIERGAFTPSGYTVTAVRPIDRAKGTR